MKAGEDVALVRFDSFANLLVPKDVQADEIETLNNLLEYARREIVCIEKRSFDDLV